MLRQFGPQDPQQQHRDRGVADHPVGHAAQKPGDLAGAMAAQDDEIHLVAGRIGDDLRAGVPCL